MDSRELLAAVRAAQGLPSNYALARLTGIPERSLQRWNTGTHTPDALTSARLAELAKLDRDFVVAAMHAQRAAAGPERDLWLQIAARLDKAGAVAAVALLSVGVVASPDAGAMALAAAAPLIGGGLYIMLSRPRAAAGRPGVHSFADTAAPAA